MWFRKTKCILPTMPPEICALIASQMKHPGRLLRCCKATAAAKPMVKLPSEMYSRSPTIDELINWLQAGSEPAKEWLSNLTYLNLSAGLKNVMFWKASFLKNTKSFGIYGKPTKKLTIQNVVVWLYLESTLFIFKRVPVPLNLTIRILPLYKNVVQDRPGYNLTSIDNLLSIEVQRQAMACNQHDYNKIDNLCGTIDTLPPSPELSSCRRYLTSLTSQPYPEFNTDDYVDNYVDDYVDTS